MSHTSETIGQVQGITDLNEFAIRFGHANYLIGSYIPEGIRTGSVLDIGSGTCNAVVAALTHGADFVLGVDLDFSAFAQVFSPRDFPEICHRYHVDSSKAMLLEVDIFKTRMYNPIFDYALMIDSLEHLPDPGRFMQYVYDCLKPGGRFLISTAPLYHSKQGHHLYGCGLPPEYEYWGHLMEGFEKEADKLNKWNLKYYRELNKITYAETITLLQQAGFHVEFEEVFPISEEDRQRYEAVKDRIQIGKLDPKVLFEEQIAVRVVKPLVNGG